MAGFAHRMARREKSRFTIASGFTTLRDGSAHLPYRPEIDGLRAVAVLSVLLYHFGVPGISGGFVGVDIFFVLSGYLIGGLLWAELDATGRIALGRFYLRRVRRLAPAFFAMALVTAFFAYLILLPFELREFGKELIAATVWLSNVLYYQSAGYFDIAAENRVLLHTWSLSVEEQFYIALPLMILLLRFSRVTLILALILGWAASLAACIWLTPVSPNATFYLFPFRAWELLSGVLLAILLRKRALPAWSWMSWVGVVVILGSVLFIQPGPAFPGWQAVFPVLGTVLLLANGQDDNAVNRLLGMRAPVFVGLISYSLYLWHWPVLVLSQYWRGGYAGWAEVLGWMALSFVLAVLSWRFVERPVRQSGRVASRPLVFGALGAGAVAIGLGGVAFVGQGLPQRFGPEPRAHIAASAGFLQDWSRCSVPATGPLAGIEVCGIGPEGPPRVLIWGDSHLRALMDGLSLAAAEEEVPGLIIWHAGCPPLFGLTKRESAATPAQDAACLAATEVLRKGLPQLETLEDVVLVARWAYYAEGAGIGRDAHNTITLSAAPGSGIEARTQADLHATALALTVKEIGQSVPRVHLFRQVPEIPEYDSRSVALALAHGHLSAAEVEPLLSVEPEALALRVAAAEAPILQAVTDGTVRLIDPWPELCAGACGVMQDGASLYFDNNHLTNDGALALRHLFRPALIGGRDGP